MFKWKEFFSGNVEYDTVEYVSFQYLDRESDEDEDEALRQEMLCALAWQIVCKVLKENDPCIDRILLGLEEFDIPESAEKARMKVVEYAVADGCYYPWDGHAPANSTRAAVAIAGKKVAPDAISIQDGRKFIFVLDKLREKYEKITASGTPVPSCSQAASTPQPKPESESKETAKGDSSPITRILKQLDPDKLVDTFSNLSPEKRKETLKDLIKEYNEAVPKELQTLLELTEWFRKICNMADGLGCETKQLAGLLNGNANTIKKLEGKMKPLPEDLKVNDAPNSDEISYIRRKIDGLKIRKAKTKNAEEIKLINELIEAYQNARRHLRAHKRDLYEDTLDDVRFLETQLQKYGNSGEPESEPKKPNSGNPEDESGTPSGTESNPENKPKRAAVSAGDFIQFLEVVGVEEDKYPPYLKKTGQMSLTTMLTLAPLNKWCRENGYPEYPE